MPGTYLITDTSNTVVHVNADDLHDGSARIGPVWTAVGTVPFNLQMPGQPANTLGPFSDSNYFTSTKPNFFTTLVGNSFLGVLIYSTYGDQYPANPVLYSDCGTTLQLGSPSTGDWTPNINSYAVTSIGASTIGGINIVFWGVDNSGYSYSRINAGPTKVVHTGQITANSTASVIGRNGSSAGYPFSQGLLYEVYLSSDAPSDSEFTYIYNQIVAAVGGYRFRTPALAKVYSRITASNYYISRYDTRVVRYTGSLQVQPNTNPLVQTVVATPSLITVTFSVPVVLAGAAATPAGWTITAPTGNVAPLTVTAVSVASNVVYLTVGEMTGGASYTLNLPGLGILGTGGEAFTGPFQQSFTGAGTSTPFVVARGIDERSAQVTFSKPVIESDAMNVANWSISPNIGITAVTAVTQSTYILTTGPQTTGTSYLVTASNIRDTAYNPI